MIFRNILASSFVKLKKPNLQVTTVVVTTMATVTRDNDLHQLTKTFFYPSEVALGRKGKQKGSIIIISVLRSDKHLQVHLKKKFDIVGKNNFFPP